MSFGNYISFEFLKFHFLRQFFLKYHFLYQFFKIQD